MSNDNNSGEKNGPPKVCILEFHQEKGKDNSYIIQPRKGEVVYLRRKGWYGLRRNTGQKRERLGKRWKRWKT